MDFLKIYDLSDNIGKNKLFEDYLAGDYVGLYFQEDVRSFHVFRILEGWNSEYDREEGSILVEHNMIDKDEVGLWKASNVLDRLKRLVRFDLNSGFENWDILDGFDSVEEAVESIVEGYMVETVKF